MEHNTVNDHTPQKDTHPPKKNRGSPKKSLFGLLSFSLALIGILLLGCIGVTAWRSYQAGEIGSLNVSLMLTLIKVSLALGVAALLLAVIAFILRRQKKGLAVVSFLLALSILFSAGVVQYTYDSVFQALDYDKEFQEIPDEDLYIVPQWESGEIDFTDVPVKVKPKEELENLVKIEGLDWPLLDATDLPSKVQPYFYSQSPEGPCYLKGDAGAIENFVLFGIDLNNLSDVLMVVSMDRVHKKIKLISIQRDSYVMVPNWGGYTKINHAFGVGQESSSIATLNLNFKLNIRDYFTVHFGEVSAIVDLLGGVDVVLDAAELDYMIGHGHTDLQIGVNHLNGAEALTYSRMRSSGVNDNEIVRTSRQREVLNSMYAAAKALPPSSYAQVVNGISSFCKTSVGSDRLLSMMIEAIGGGYTIENYALIDMVKYWGGQFGPGNLFYLVYDLDVAADRLYRTIYEDLYVSGYS